MSKAGRSRRSILKAGLGVALLPALGAGCSGDAVVAPFRGVQPTPKNPRIRRSVATLSAAERLQYVDGVLALKATQSPFDPSLSYYDQMVYFHREAVRYARTVLGYSVAHQTPAFLPWHRKFMLLPEDAIRAVAFPDFALPYWDWTDADSLDVMFSDDFMGPILGDETDNYAVTTGPFRKGVFPLNLTPIPIGDNDSLNQSPFNFLTRGPKSIDLPTTTDIENLMLVTRYSAPPYDNTVDYSESFNNTLLGIPNGTVTEPFNHSAVHAHVGGSWTDTYYDSGFTEQSTTFSGSMAVLDGSPNDPVFFLHHCNVDRLWAEWEAVNGNLYEPDSGYSQGFNLDDPFYPYDRFSANPLMTATGLTPASMLDLEPLGFTYDMLLT